MIVRVLEAYPTLSTNTARGLPSNPIIGMSLPNTPKVVPSLGAAP
jgi:hypothetical protein